MIIYKTWAIVSLLVYFGVLLFVSVRKNKNETKEDFFLAGRKFPHWALAMTFVASWFGGTSALVSVDQSFEQGISAWWIIGSPSIAASIVLYFLAKAIRNVGSLSQTEIIENRYNRTAGLIVSVIVIWYMITFASSQMVALGKFFSSMFGTTYLTAIILGVSIVAVYSSIGGFRAVVLTDIIQFGLLAIGLVITAVVAVKHSGGWENIQSAAAVKGQDDYFNFFANFRNNFFYLLSFGLAWIISADAWQRLAATKDESEARKMPLGGIAFFIPLYFLVAIIGVASGAIFNELPEGGIVAAITTQYLNPVLGSIVFLGVAAAIMSTMSTAINTGSLYVTDFFNRYVSPNASNKTVVRVGIASTMAISLIGAFISLRIPDALWVLWMSSDILASGVLVPLILAFIWKRGTAAGAIASLVMGSSFVLYNFMVDMGVKLPTFWPESAERILYGLSLSLLSYIIVSYFTKPEYEKVAGFLKSTRSTTITSDSAKEKIS
ncbi:sodium:solute symporter family protein [Bacillus norwichensis]|uniref:Sodium:solute symporter family protein n=1 Tax=Bacillus norwichensis TaxID=2762217 RepID=A0ABR8VIH7_9BACI|nr:sodium:solute symporter family protein [Bacillus norwichensis]MBD8004533.1 sodium:solute symporter family protein [Bacillus norwichensis]